MARNKKQGDKYNGPFASSLRQLMENRNVTQADLALKIEVTPQTVSQYCNGISEPGYDNLVKIADYLDVSIDYLLGRTGDPNRQASAVDELGLAPCVINGILKIKTGKLLSDRLAQDGLNIFLTESLKDDATFYRYINYLCGAVKTEKEDASTYLAMFGNDANCNLSMDEKYRLAELTILNTLEEAAPGITHLMSITVGHRRIKPELDNVCELFREMLERMTGYKQLKEG